MLPNRSTRANSHTKRLVALGLAVTVGFSAILVFVLWESRAQERGQAQQAAANLVATISSEIDRNLELYNLSLQAVVDGINLPGLHDLSPELRHRVLFDRAATAKDMGSIFVLDANGNVVVDSRAPAPPADNHAQADYFQVQTQSSITGPYLSRPWRAPNGEFLIAISRRLANPDGSFAGAVVGTLRLSYFHDMFSKIKLGNKDALALIRTDGSIIMRFPFAAAFIGQSLASSPIFNRTAAYQSGSFEHTAKIDGVDRLYVFQHIGENPLVLSYGTSLEAVYAGWRQRAWLIGSLMLAMGAINITLIVFLANALRRRTEAEQQLSILATTDSLTGLCNRRRLDEMFDIEWQRALRSQSPIALLMIDADNFKAYNDKFGHQAGDNVLVDIARCIKATARRATDINARYGGEEFAVLLPGVAVADAIDLAEKIRASLADLFARADQEGATPNSPTVSIGVASFVPRPGSQSSDLFHAADAALYQAKCKGRNCTVPAIPTPERTAA